MPKPTKEKPNKPQKPVKLPAHRPPYFNLRRTRGQWYWRVKAGNGKSIAIGGEGYHNEKDLLKVLPLIQSAIAAKLANMAIEQNLARK
jgi:uncharacterized protein YegP (UPF0339 family)